MIFQAWGLGALSVGTCLFTTAGKVQNLRVENYQVNIIQQNTIFTENGFSLLNFTSTHCKSIPIKQKKKCSCYFVLKDKTLIRKHNAF